MNRINCIIIEDEYLARAKLRQYITQCSELNLLGAFTTVAETIESKTIDQCGLFFLDINLPGINGLEFAKNLSQNSSVIFTTAYSEFAVEGFNLNAVDYLLKPIEFDRFKIAVTKAINKQVLQQQEEGKYILLKQARELIRCNLNEVYYIKGMQEYLYWKTTSGKIITLGSLAVYAEKLKPHQFIRIHKSYIVNLNKVDTISTKTVTINKEELPIGNTFAKSFRISYKNAFDE